MDALRSVARTALDGARLVWSRPFALLVPLLGAIVMLGMSLCVLPFFLGTFLIGWAVEDVVRAPRRGVGTTTLVGLCMFGVVALPSAGMWVATSALDVRPTLGVAHLVALLVVPMLGLLVGPFVTVAPHMARRGIGLEDALGRALVGATAGGWLTSLLRGGLMGLGALVVALYAFAMHVMFGDTGASGVGALVCQCTFLLIVASWQIAFACACANQDDALLAGAAAPTARVRLMLAPLVAMVFLLGATFVAAIRPLAPWQGRPHTPLTCEPELADYGPHGLSVHPLARSEGEARSFVVETADGGGAGAIVDAQDRDPAQVCVDGEGVVWLVWGYLAGSGIGDADASYVPIDERGVRLDDGIGDRLAVRSGVVFGVSVVLGFCLLLIGLGELARRSALLDVMGREADALRTTAGRLLVSHARITERGDVEGRAQFTSDDGSYAFSLPPLVRLVGARGPLTKDTKALLLATEPLESLSLREGLARWPRSAILILGQPDDARRAVTAELSRVVAVWAAASTIAFAIAAVTLLVAL